MVLIWDFVGFLSKAGLQRLENSFLSAAKFVDIGKREVPGAIDYQSQSIFQEYRKVEVAQTPLILRCRTIIRYLARPTLLV